MSIVRGLIASSQCAMRALILANGVPPSRTLLQSLHADADLFLAADGAANQLVTLDLIPHVVLGDFDSLAPEAKARLHAAEFIHAYDQEASDLDKAIEFLRDRGATRITITGSSGGRVDHSLTTISLLLKYGSDVAIRVAEDGSDMWLLHNEVQVEGNAGDTVSIVVFDTVHGVTTEGLEWPLMDATLYPGSRGVSNRLSGSAGTIRIGEGKAIVCHLRSS